VDLGEWIKGHALRAIGQDPVSIATRNRLSELQAAAASLGPSAPVASNITAPRVEGSPAPVPAWGAGSDSVAPRAHQAAGGSVSSTPALLDALHAAHSLLPDGANHANAVNLEQGINGRVPSSANPAVSPNTVNLDLAMGNSDGARPLGAPGSVDLDAGLSSPGGLPGGRPPVGMDFAVGDADGAVATAAARRGAQGAAEAGKAGWLKGLLGGVDSALASPDLGLGHATAEGLNKMAGALPEEMPLLARGLRGLGGIARVAGPTAAIAGAALPVATGAMEGYGTAGTGGAVLQGGAAGIGALIGGAIGAPISGFGAVIGAGIGSAIGNAIGGAASKGAVGLVDAANRGDTGIAGSVGRMLDPVIDSTVEHQQREVMEQENSPIMKRIRDERNAREADARYAQNMQILASLYS
jgi:hypothetical protein